MTESRAKPVLHIITNNHFDQTWRRCWDRPLIDRGRTFVSYADLEAFYMLDNLALARQYPEYRFEVECAYVVRKFIERYPAMLETLRALVRAGRFAVTGGGEAIIDGNMVLGESLVRNFVDGLLWVEDTLGFTSRLSVRNDAFGNPAQLPQILRGCEIVWATGMSYTPAMGLYWRGLDGSTILHRSLSTAAKGGGNVKYPPCAVCGGTGVALHSTCPACRGRGIDDSVRAWLPGEVDRSALEPFNAGLVWMNPEELLPNPAILDWARERRLDPLSQYEVRFSRQEDLWDTVRPWLDAVDSPSEEELHPEPELNPNNSGCLVTRIKTKQTVRRQEYAVMAAEVLASLAVLRGAPYPGETLKDIRHRQYFTMFHDAITATHVDAAYEELQDAWQEIDRWVDASQKHSLGVLVRPEPGVVSVINLTGQESTQVVTLDLDGTARALMDDAGRNVTVLSRQALEGGCTRLVFLAASVPAFSARLYRPASTRQVDAGPRMLPADEGGQIENSRFRVEAGPNGIKAIYDKRLERDILAAGEYHPAELILEHDEGSPWATLSPDQTRLPLSPYTKLEAIETGPACGRLWFTIDVPREGGFSGKSLRARLCVTLVEGLEFVDFHLTAWWDAFNHRLRVAMPVPFSGRHLYEVPYGIVERKPYQPWFGWAGANGDWPAINWAGVEGAETSVALFNRGTPSYRIEPGTSGGDVILLSLLRSPAIPTYLHEPEFYTMTAYDGMRDMGEHAFSFAVGAYDRPFAASPVVSDADSYNAGLLAVAGRADLPALPCVTAGPARIAAVKGAETGRALVFRLVEFRGQGGEVMVALPGPVLSVQQVNLLERAARPIDVKDGQVRLILRPWEIATIKINLNG